MVQTAFLDLAQRADNGFIPTTSRPDLERLEQVSLSQERQNELAAAVHDGECPTQARFLGQTMLARSGASWNDLPPERQADLAHGLTRALIEQQRLFVYRLSERLLPWVPVDPLFGAINFTSPTEKPPSPEVNCTTTGPTVAEAVQAYLVYGKSRWTPKTLKGRERMLAYLVDHLRPAKPLVSVNPQDVRQFRDGIKKLRCNHFRSPGSSFLARQTENTDKQIAPKTASLIYEPTKAFFKWCKSVEGYLTADPAADVKIDLPKVQGAKGRRPFTADELKLLFSAPVFTGSLSFRRRFAAGSQVSRDAYYWIPILGYYTGCRLGELVQLHVEDIDLNTETPHLVVTDAGGGKAGSGSEKHVKSAAGVRKVPLHPHLLDLGFAQFVESRRKLKKPRLFYEIRFGADQQASTVFSKWFGRLASSRGLSDPALVFHSLRHGVADAFRNALVPPYLI